jgi:hypothetical protein
VKIERILLHGFSVIWQLINSGEDGYPPWVKSGHDRHATFDLHLELPLRLTMATYQELDIGLSFGM